MLASKKQREGERDYKNIHYTFVKTIAINMDGRSSERASEQGIPSDPSSGPSAFPGKVFVYKKI